MSDIFDNTLIDVGSRWFTSSETRQLLKINGCQLMHMRERGELTFKKVGNAFYYLLPTKLACLASKARLESNVIPSPH